MASPTDVPAVVIHTKLCLASTQVLPYFQYISRIYITLVNHLDQNIYENRIQYDTALCVQLARNDWHNMKNHWSTFPHVWYRFFNAY